MGARKGRLIAHDKRYMKKSDWSFLVPTVSVGMHTATISPNTHYHAGVCERGKNYFGLMAINESLNERRYYDV